MYLRDYEYVIELAKSGSILKAAQKLSISRSALSKHILKIEEEVGMPLFERGGKTFTLTYAGERYLSWAVRIQELNQQLDKEMRDIQHEQSGRIRLGCPKSRAPFIINSILPEFRKKYPKLSIMLRENSTRIIERMMMNNELDLVLAQSDMKRPEFEYIPLTKEEQVLVVPREHPLADCGVRKPGFKYPWIDLRRFRDDGFVVCYPDQAMRQITEEEFRKHGIPLRISLQLRDIDSCILAAARGLGNTVLSSDNLIREESLRSSVRIFSFGDVPVERMLVLEYRSASYIDSSEKDLIALFREKCG